MKPRTALILRDTFRTGITLKGIDGVLETIGGVLVWFIKPSALSEPLQWLCQHELSRDPHDFIAMQLLHVSQKFANSDPLFASLYLLSHGLTKVVLVIALWLDRLWAYPLTIFVLGVFMVYQVYRFTHTHSVMLVVLTIFDGILIFLTWEEFREQERLRNERIKK